MRVLGRWSVASLLTILVNVASGLVALALVLTAVMLVLAPVVQGPVEVSAGWIGVGTKMTIPVSFSVDARTHRVTAPSSASKTPSFRTFAGCWHSPFGAARNCTGNMVLLAIMFALALWVLGNLRAVFQPEGRPAVCEGERNPHPNDRVALYHRRAARAAMVFFQNYYAMTHFSADGLRFDAPLDLNFMAIIDGLIILVIAEVFRAGTRLDEEQSLTV